MPKRDSIFSPLGGGEGGSPLTCHWGGHSGLLGGCGDTDYGLVAAMQIAVNPLNCVIP